MVQASLPRSGWQKRTPLMVWFSIAMVVLIAVLPNALNLPQSNPNTVPEFAPVPSDEGQAPPGGNISALGVGSSGSLGPRPGDIDGDLPGAGRGDKAVTKRCVGRPPRQAEDPMAPPCVPFFEGDNGGATYKGVTEDEIRVVVYYDGEGNAVAGDGEVDDLPPDGTICDVDKPPNTDRGCFAENTGQDSTWVRFVRAYSNYFNSRYQTYNRRIHFYVYWGACCSQQFVPESKKRAIAADIDDRLDPFATLNHTIFTYYRDAFVDAISQRGVFVFGGGAGMTGLEPYKASYFQSYAPKVWSYAPDIEHWAELYADYVCTKMPPGSTVQHATGGVGLNGLPFNGRPRKFGFISTSDVGYPGVQEFARQAAEQLKARCGIVPAEWVKYTYHGAICCSDVQVREGTENAAKLKQADVTTLLWLGGFEFFTGQGGDRVGYYPEVVHAGDGAVERNTFGRFQNQNWQRNAWTVSLQLRYLSPEESIPNQACKEGDPNLTRAKCDLAQAFFREYYLLFRAIQAAGPRLTPESVDRGLHAIPRISSTNPDLASCFFDSPGDYTCVKDQMEMWWDASGRAPGHNSPGCWRLVQGGRRYLVGDWPSTDEVFKPEGAPCNAFQGGGALDGQ